MTQQDQSTAILMVVRTDTGEVDSVYMPSEKTRAANRASRLYHGSKSGPYGTGEGEPWAVVPGTAVPS